MKLTKRHCIKNDIRNIGKTGISKTKIKEKITNKTMKTTIKFKMTFIRSFSVQIYKK